MREFLRRGRPHFSTLDVRTVLRDAFALAKTEAAANGISVEFEVADGLPSIFGDHIQLQQVILNLVHNAVEAIVGTRRSDGCIRIGTLNDLNAEWTGGFFDGTGRFIVSVQHNVTGHGVVLDITGWR